MTVPPIAAPTQYSASLGGLDRRNVRVCLSSPNLWGGESKPRRPLIAGAWSCCERQDETYHQFLPVPGSANRRGPSVWSDYPVLIRLADCRCVSRTRLFENS